MRGSQIFLFPHISKTDPMTLKFYFIFRNIMQRGVSVKIHMKTNLTDFTQYEVKNAIFLKFLPRAVFRVRVLKFKKNVCLLNL